MVRKVKNKRLFRWFLLGCLIFSGIMYVANGNAQSTHTVYLPIIQRPVGPVTTAINGSSITIDSPFMPSAITASNPGDASQVASSYSLAPYYEEFSIIAVPYGTIAPIENLPTATQGGATGYRSTLQAFRSQQGGTPKVAPSITMFSQSVVGSYSIVNIIAGNPTPKQTLIAEWVVEANNQIWIVRVVKDLSDGTDPNTFVNSLQELTVVKNGSTNQLASVVSNDVANATGSIPAPSWWSGNCNVNNHSGSFPLATYDGLTACGPVGSAKLVQFFPGAVGQYEWQCTELAKRYLYLKYGVNPYSANGKDVVNNMPSSYIGTTFERIFNGTAQKYPMVGDVISFGPGTTFGHVAVVMSSNVDSNGNGSINIIEQNWGQSGQRSLPVNNWRVGGSLVVSNWLHEIEVVPTPTATPIPNPTPVPTPVPSPTPIPQNGNIIRVSIASDGTAGDNHSYTSEISSNGRYIVFISSADNFDTLGASAYNDVFIHDLETQTTQRVSASLNGGLSNYGVRDEGLSISDNGRYIAFVSTSSNLTDNFTYNQQVYVRDMETQTTEIISVSSDGIQGNSNSNEPSISGDGRYVVFRSRATNLTSENSNLNEDIYMHDRQTGETSLVSYKYTDGNAADASSRNAEISSDGSFVVFVSISKYLVPNDNNEGSDFFLYNIQTKQISLLPVHPDSSPVGARNIDISHDGNYIAFATQDKFPSLMDNDDQTDVFIYNMTTAQTTIASTITDDYTNGSAYEVTISQNAQYVSFKLSATSYYPGVFVLNQNTGITTRISVGINGQEENDSSGAPSMDATGQYITFTSQSSNLIENDQYNYRDIFLYHSSE